MLHLRSWGGLGWGLSDTLYSRVQILPADCVPGGAFRQRPLQTTDQLQLTETCRDARNRAGLILQHSPNTEAVRAAQAGENSLPRPPRGRGGKLGPSSTGDHRPHHVTSLGLFPASPVHGGLQGGLGDLIKFDDQVG
jgi:hypothetical protein